VRSQAQGEIKLALLAGKEQILRLRNIILGTRAENWINVIPPARYGINLEAMTDLVSAARHEGLPVLVYVPPRPSGRRFPFDPAVYARFKSDSERMARAFGASFANIEEAVADDLWGEADNGAGEIVTDPSHFTAAGHRLMADALTGALASTILPQMR
jgi:lysophospholipase L1-like esterase